MDPAVSLPTSPSSTHSHKRSWPSARPTSVTDSLGSLPSSHASSPLQSHPSGSWSAATPSRASADYSHQSFVLSQASSPHEFPAASSPLDPHSSPFAQSPQPPEWNSLNHLQQAYFSIASRGNSETGHHGTSSPLPSPGLIPSDAIPYFGQPYQGMPFAPPSDAHTLQQHQWSNSYALPVSAPLEPSSRGDSSKLTLQYPPGAPYQPGRARPSASSNAVNSPRHHIPESSAGSGTEKGPIASGKKSWASNATSSHTRAAPTPMVPAQLNTASLGVPQGTYETTIRALGQAPGNLPMTVSTHTMSSYPVPPSLWMSPVATSPFSPSTATELNRARRFITSPNASFAQSQLDPSLPSASTVRSASGLSAFHGTSITSKTSAPPTRSPSIISDILTDDLFAGVSSKAAAELVAATQNVTLSSSFPSPILSGGSPVESVGSHHSNQDEADPEQMAKEDPLATKVWKMFSRTKASLPHAQRMENLTWRMMALALRKKREEDKREEGLKLERIKLEKEQQERTLQQQQQQPPPLDSKEGVRAEEKRDKNETGKADGAASGVKVEQLKGFPEEVKDAEETVEGDEVRGRRVDKGKGRITKIVGFGVEGDQDDDGCVFWP
ncbi:hypothetical protein BOTBODRAFT_206053 [Botryobasidium botryosum FD-172 SS1]|uniref:Nitrogen regulatory protein areA GATA-like domain-containing protein n=1 Tax=Botryobasidium botryosum (strain FD-172 SS1) TaxID=930990 RepID=A0A067N102_BOTB1|nr:hypothetical protein BOTBODRAFT_206053 [Botryobasidium botryosum FD-172 SS1]